MSAPYFEHVTGPLERWDTIAHRYYGDASRYGPILAANREMVTGPAGTDGKPGPLGQIPAVLPPHTVIRVPVLEEARRPAPEELPPWFR